VSNPRIAYAVRSDHTPHTERTALVAAYLFIIDCHAKKEAATSPVRRPDDGTKIKEDSANEHRST